MPIQSEKPGSTRLATLVVFGFIVLFFLAGCAGKPWSGKFEPDQVKSYKTIIEGQIKAGEACPSTLDAEVAVTWKNTLETKAFSGYLQLQLPSSVKFVTTNPLGQTLFALVSDGEAYSTVNAITQQYISGSLSSLAMRNNIPQELLTGNWGTWLSGRIIATDNEEITDVRKDSAGRGLWVIIKKPKDASGNKEYILVDSTGNHPLFRILMNASDDPIAKIQYRDWQQKNRCGQPMTFDITDLPMGAEITLHLSDIITDKVFDKTNFILMPPPGYFIQLLP
jgi:outer membrane lipoprotein-sorting protein